MPEPSVQTGGCHCGKVRFQVKTAYEPLITCDCSICQKTGSILTFVPAPDFTLISGEDALTDYQFNKKVIHHLFCSTCGIRSFARGKNPDGSDSVAINVRCLDDIDIATLAPFEYDGKSL
jgi:hypothetical protein